MWNKHTNELADTKCEHDYSDRHRWDKIGVDNGFVVYQCGQCGKCVQDPIVWIMKDNAAKKLRAEALREN